MKQEKKDEIYARHCAAAEAEIKELEKENSMSDVSISPEHAVKVLNRLVESDRKAIESTGEWMGLQIELRCPQCRRTRMHTVLEQNLYQCPACDHTHSNMDEGMEGLYFGALIIASVIAIAAGIWLSSIFTG